MRGINLVIVGGNLGEDPTLRYTSGGQAVVSLSLAINEKWKGGDGEDKERTTWIRVTVFGKQAEACFEHLKKGSSVLVQGRLVENKWQDQSGAQRSRIDIMANRVDFLTMSAKTKDDESPPFSYEDEVPF